MIRVGSLVLGAIACVLAAAPAGAQDWADLLSRRAPEDRPSLLVVGSLHFANPGRDIANVEVGDVMTPLRQAEIAEVVRQLAALQPTHVAIEWPADRQAALDALYAEYHAGEYELGPREADQIGLRLAAAVGLERVHAIDWNGAGPGDEASYNWPAYGQANGQGDYVAALIATAQSDVGPTLEGRTVGQMLRARNTPEELARAHRFYFDIARVGDDQAQPGAAWVGHWYARNLRIFNRLVEIADIPDDRIVVIYGSGHAFLLNRFAEESGAFVRLDVGDVIAE